VLRTEIKTGGFYYSKNFLSVAKVIDSGRLWGNEYARIWLPNSDAVVRVPASDLSSLSPQSSALSTEHIAYVAAAAKVAEVLEFSTQSSVPSPQHCNTPVLLAPMESNVIPLPHQIHALSRAISGDRVR